MAPMRGLRPALGLFCLLACGALAVAGCGGGSSTSSQVNPEAETGKSRPAPPKSAFPATEGRSLRAIIEAETTKGGTQLAVTPGALAFYPGANRYSFTIAEKVKSTGGTGKEVADAEAAVYYVEVPGHKATKSAARDQGLAARAQKKAIEGTAIGPFPARVESLATKPPFRSNSTTEDADVASVVYSTELSLPAGEYRPMVLTKENGQVETNVLPSIDVGEFAKIPRAGEMAPLIHTPTAQSVGGDLARLTTRNPPDTLNKVDYAEVLGKEPILILFTTPQFCQSRVCGPAVDVVQQAQHQFEGKANFIHMEIYNDNEPSQGVRPQVRKFHLPSEPWLFAIDREGRIGAVIEGGFGTELMDKTVEKVVGE
jgi:hypothetical protein